VVLFALAMISKESAVILPALFFLAIPPAEWRRAIPRLLPYVILAALAAAAIFAAQSSSFRFSDGSFSLHAPFWITWAEGNRAAALDLGMAGACSGPPERVAADCLDGGGAHSPTHSSRIRPRSPAARRISPAPDWRCWQGLRFR
jgi:hypothetical protein